MSLARNCSTPESNSKTWDAIKSCSLRIDCRFSLWSSAFSTAHLCKVELIRIREASTTIRILNNQKQEVHSPTPVTQMVEHALDFSIEEDRRSNLGGCGSPEWKEVLCSPWGNSAFFALHEMQVTSSSRDWPHLGVQHPSITCNVFARAEQ